MAEINKSFINDRLAVVGDAIDGLLRASAGADLARLDGDPDIKVVLRARPDPDRVALIAGGGSGHEPAHAGYVGRGMLTAAVCGELFASPSVDAVLAAIRAVTGPAGTLLIIKNYTGDRLNFGLAAELAQAEGHRVATVLVDDDVALPGSRQRRAIAGTVLVHKLAGAAAAEGRDLRTVHAIASDAARAVRSLGLALTPCAMPGQRRPDRLRDDEAELGLGIHGEPGAAVVPFERADALVADLARRLLDALGAEAEQPLAVMLNALGAVTPLEMGIVTEALARSPLGERIALLIGPAPFMTALDMRGISLSVLPLDDERRRLLEQPAGPSAWLPPRPLGRLATVPVPDTASVALPRPSDHGPTRAIIDTIAATLRADTALIDALDARIGDGDTGTTLARMAEAVVAQSAALPLTDTAAALAAIGGILRRTGGGSSGVLLATLCTATAARLGSGATFGDALTAGLARMSDIGGARIGDRTMIDALGPAFDALANGTGLEAAAVAARAGADRTASMSRAGPGRASYVPEAALAGTPDPGAEAVARVVEALAREFRRA